MKNDHYPFLELPSSHGGWQAVEGILGYLTTHGHGPGVDKENLHYMLLCEWAWARGVNGGALLFILYLPELFPHFLFITLFLKIVSLWHVRELCPLVPERWREAPNQ